MSNVEKLTIALTPEMASTIRGAVDAGEYASTSEAIRDAVRLWQARRDNHGFTTEELRALWQVGMESGVSARSLDDVKAEGRRRLHQS